MITAPSSSLAIVDGLDLPDEFRSALKPDEVVADHEGRGRRLPRYFYQVTSWDEALATQLTPNFGLWELLDVDFREVSSMRRFPRYVPCAIALLAAQLETFREAVGTVVRIAANGGYRSPSHALSRTATTHSWGAAANIYRIGNELMDSQDRIEKYTALARRVLPSVWTRLYGTRRGDAFDHVHVDLGYAVVVPHNAAGEPVAGSGR